MCHYQVCIKFDPLPTSDLALLQVGNYTGERTIHREAKISNAFGVSEKIIPETHRAVGTYVKYLQSHQPSIFFFNTSTTQPL